MELEEALQKRRSVRKYTDEEITDEQIDRLLHAAMSGPSACNKKPWEFYVVKNPEILAKLRKASPFSNHKGKIAIVVCGALHRALPLELKDYWIEDTSAATENILLEATSLGLGALWCGVYPQKKNIKNVQEALGLKESTIPLNILYIGHPAEFPEARDQYEEKYVHILD